MRVRTIAAVAVSAALAVPALAQAQPNRHRIDAPLAPGKVLSLSFGTVPQGEFAFSLRAAGDGDKRLILTQQRDTSPTSFRVLTLPSPQAADVCQGAAGSVVCRGITTPATPGDHGWRFKVKNQSRRPMTVSLTIVWRPVPSAG